MTICATENVPHCPIQEQSCFGITTKMTQIALFGTSADPPTVGHQAILEWLAFRFDGVAVWAADNPFKANQTSLIHRQAMLRLLVHDMARHHQNIGVYSHLSYPQTLKSVQQAQADWPEAELTLVVGSDILGSLPSWYQVSRLLRLVHLLIVLRPDVLIDPAQLDVLRTLGARFTVADFVGPDVSSTAYRQTGDPNGVIPAITDYIRSQGLYAATGKGQD
jgi:nicotinate-nucleotide adenylyltransferase